MVPGGRGNALVAFDHGRIFKPRGFDSVALQWGGNLAMNVKNKNIEEAILVG